MKKGKRKRKTKSFQLVKKKVKPDYFEKDPYSFEPFDKWVWMQFDGNKIVDVGKFIEKHKDRMFYIGTDSQQYSKYRKCVFSSVLIAHDFDPETGRGHGGSVIRYVDKRAMIPKEALSARLTVEVQRSIEICKFVEEKLLDLSDDDHDRTKNLVGITIDCNSSDTHKSGKYGDALVGMVMAYGWKAFIKPDSWASSKVADRAC